MPRPPLTPDPPPSNTAEEGKGAKGLHYCPRIIDLVQEEEEGADAEGKKARMILWWCCAAPPSPRLDARAAYAGTPPH